MVFAAGDHIVRSYDEELQRLNARIQRMGAIAIEQTRDAVALLVHRDADTIVRVMDRENEMNELEYAVNLHVVRLIALRQPMADDLRTVITSLKIAGMLERVGDYTTHAARRAPDLLDSLPDLPVTEHFAHLGRLIVAMLEQTMAALSAHNADGLDRIRDMDTEVDIHHTDLFRTLLTLMSQDPANIPACTNLMFVSKNLERIGDQATNIAEQAYYRIAGRVLPPERVKRDTSSSDMIDFVVSLSG